MKKRIIQILLALSLIFYKSTWFRWIFNHFAARFVPASREYFLLLAFLELSVTLLTVLYLLVFEGKKNAGVEMEMEISSLFASCLWSQLSFRFCVFFFNPSNVQSNRFK